MIKTWQAIMRRQMHWLNVIVNNVSAACSYSNDRLLQNAPPASPRSSGGSSLPRRAVSTTAPPVSAAVSQKVPPIKYNTIARVIQVPHTFVSYNVTRPAVCQFCNKLMTLFRQAKQCRGVLLDHCCCFAKKLN